MAFVGTSGLLFGVGFAGSSPAVSNGVVNCTGKTVFAADKTPAEQVDAIAGMVELSPELICLSGHFEINAGINVNDSGTSNVVIHGLGDSSIKHPGGQVFYSLNPAQNNGWDLTIDNLTVKGSIDPIWGYNVRVKDSKFLDNTGLAISATTDFGGVGGIYVSDSYFARNSGVLRADANISISKSTFEANVSPEDQPYLHILSDGGSVDVFDSTFEGNRTPGKVGGAIAASTVRVSDSTFEENSSLDGGAIFASTVSIKNSSFVDNTATNEGGAIYASDGTVYFSTFVNNLAPTPPQEPGDTPGNAIYKEGASIFHVGGNIFAGSSPHPQLGIGAPQEATPFTDNGGNVFSTLSTVETDMVEDPTTKFGHNLTSIFGNASPALTMYSPNLSGTKTLGLAAGSPALRAVPQLSWAINPDTEDPEPISRDQRGTTRTYPASAGAFEGVAPVTPSPSPTPNPTTAPATLAKTGSQNPVWVAITAGSMVVIGALVTGVFSRLKRRTS